MTRGALIIGATPAGLQAAIDLADSGIHVHLVEPTPFLGSDGSGDVAPHLFHTRLLEVSKHANVTTWTNTHVYRVEGEPGAWTVELRQHPRYIDLSRCTACGDCVQVCPVEVPGTGRKAIHLANSGQPGCAAIDKLGKPPCSNTCPGGIHVQGYVALAAEGRFQEAIDLIREAIPFPGICGRICTHPCEINCRRAEVDKPVAIRLLKRFLADWELAEGSQQPDAHKRQSGDRREQRLAVVGAGPGGMAAAEQLARMGYGVTVFEKLPVIGGMMTVGIPEFRLPRDVIAREYHHIQELGVEIRLNTTIGPDGDLDLDDLFGMGYGAVCLAVGAHHGHALRIAGEEWDGVVQGIELLQTISFSQQLDDAGYQAALRRWLRRGPETRVAILGGGNTAMDVSRSLRRFGVHDVRILYRRTRAEMPAMPEEVEDAEREGVALEFLIAPVRVLGDAENGVSGLECLRMKLGEPDASGRRRPVPLAGSEFVIDLDLVVLAIGQAPDLDVLGPEHEVAVTRDERINVDAVTFMTSRPGVFACGDAITADKMAVIEAIGFGKQAAAGIDAYLRGLEPHETVVDARQVPIARREMSPAELAPKPRTPVPVLAMEQRLCSYAEVELGYSAEQAVAEAQRCLVCGPCSECLACVRACKPGAVIHQERETLATLEIGAILYCGNGECLDDWPALERADLLRVAEHDLVAASAAAARAMFELFAERQPRAGVAQAGGSRDSGTPEGRDRLGVFVCQCGGEISDVVDTSAVCERALGWPGVVHAEVLPFSCSKEAADTMAEAVRSHGLSGAVLAACSCCAIDQVCYSCTFQRVRCKSNLGVFPELPLSVPHTGLEFANIREQCAWAHADDPQAATGKALALTAAAVAKLRTARPRRVEAQPAERSVLVLGSGPAARTCVEALARQGIAVRQVRGVPGRVQRANRRYRVVHADASWEAQALILAPAAAESGAILSALGENGDRPRVESAWGAMATHRPGVFYCDPALDPSVVGAAAAARSAAWLGRSDGQADPITAVVNPARCRACGTCVEICEFGAPHLRGEEPQRTSWIDPAICTGCATCAAHCPSGAISAGYATDEQLVAMLAHVLLPTTYHLPTVVLFTCSWGAYSALETAGAQRLPYAAVTRPLKVQCLGQLSPGLILKAFEKGAAGVLLLSCPPGECHYDFGNRRAEEMFAQAREMASLLGIREERLQLDSVGAGGGKTFVEKVQAFCAGLNGKRA
jgi:NADPH-dependent glutamate synthase beta subunit-like oxidoreductase/coenzyme F420-reducing hydrogenase delta subunit/NAD-dependent dihydropyrimidine dehydrogenase PreA subunit